MASSWIIEQVKVTCRSCDRVAIQPRAWLEQQALYPDGLSRRPGAGEHHAE